MGVQYKEDLDALRCGRCEGSAPASEDPVYFHSTCHPEESTWVEYFDGVVTVRCSACNKEVVAIAVSRKGA